MNRRIFLAAAAGTALAYRPLRARAVQQSPMLRVLLGNADVQRLPGGGFLFGGRQYRGDFSVTSLGVINTVPLDDYLYSVVPREMSPAWPPSALQVQAICSRTYVLRRIDPSRPYDIVPSHLQQVYEGMGTESPTGRAAVDATAGLVLVYGSSYADAEYSSCCGGHTESASDAWGGAAVPYLGGVACPYCTQSPDYRWTRTVSLLRVQRAMQPHLNGLGSLASVDLGSLDASGRVRSFTLVAERGSVSIPGSTFRIAVGTGRLLSLLIRRLTVAGGRMQLEGGGNGHGVGLCQWGARGIALEKGSPAATLGFYFPGTRIAAWTSVSPPPTITNSRGI